MRCVSGARGWSAGLAIAACLFANALHATTPIHHIKIVDRLLYGPGPFPDQKLKQGHVRFLEFDAFMHATVKPFNNGSAEPNVTGEAGQGTPVDGMMSDGTRMNEHIEMGNAIILNGQFNLLLGAVEGGPTQGETRFYLDKDYNWTIEDDIAIDPGFAEGVIRVDSFIFSTGPRAIPASMQTQSGAPGGIDNVGTLRAGEIVVGHVGDDNADGLIDGVFMAVGRFPLTAIFLPGAPFVQRFQFESDIPVDALSAALLTTASARNSLRFYVNETQGGATKPSIDKLPEFSVGRWRMAAQHLQRASQERRCGNACQAAAKTATAIAEKMSKLPAQELKAALPQADELFSLLLKVHSAK